MVCLSAQGSLKIATKTCIGSALAVFAFALACVAASGARGRESLSTQYSISILTWHDSIGDISQRGLLSTCSIDGSFIRKA